MEKDKQQTKKKRYLLIFLLLFLLFLASCNAFQAFMAKSNNDKPIISLTINSQAPKENGDIISDETVDEEIKQSHSIAIVTSDGGSAVTNVNTAFAGENINIAITPDIDYEVVEIRLNDTPLNAVEFIMPNEDVVIYIGFIAIGAPRYQILKDNVKDGKFTTDKSIVTVNESFNIKTYPDVGYEFDKITATNATVNGFKATARGTGDITVKVEFEKTIWEITDNKDTVQNGTFTVDKKTAVLDEIIKVDLSPNVGYELDEITATNATVNGTDIASTGTGDIDIEVTFKKIVWNVTSNENTVQNGSFTVDRKTAVLDDVIKVDSSPSVGYELDKITATNATVNGTNITSTGTGNIDIAVTYKKTIWNVSSNEKTVQNGSFTVDKTTAVLDDVATVTLSPNVGYKLDTITATNAIVNGNKVTSTGTGDIDIKVTFKKIIWNVTSNENTVQNGSFTVDRKTVVLDDVIKVDSSPSVGYELDKITATNATVNGTNITSTGTGNIDIAVTYKKTIWNVSNNEKTVQNGSFTVDKTTAVLDDVVTVTLSPNVGYKLDAVTATNAIVNGNKVTSTGTGDIDIKVTFKKIIWNISSNEKTVQNGTFSLDKFTVAIDEIITVTLSPVLGYELDTITATNATVSGTDITSTGTGDVEVTVSFKKITWSVKSNKDTVQNGSFTIDKTSIVIDGESIVKVSPDVGYELDKITATNATVSGNKVISKGTGNIEITVTFKKIVWNVSKSNTTNGNFSLEKTIISIGGVITVSVTSNSGYMLDKITATNAIVNGNVITSTGTGDVEVSVTFRTSTVSLFPVNEHSVITGWHYPGKLSGMDGIVGRQPAIYPTYMNFVYWNMDGYMYIYSNQKVDFTNVKSFSVYANNDYKESYGRPLEIGLCADTYNMNSTYHFFSYHISTNGWRTADTSHIKGSYYVRAKIYGAASASISHITITYQDNTTLTLNTKKENAEKLNTHKINKSVATNGTYTLPSSAVHKEKVTIDVTPSIGYTLEYIKVNNAVIVGKSFVMPDEDVNVEVLFVPIQ